MKKQCVFKIITILLCIPFLCVAFISCTPEEVDPENLKKPDVNSLITYTISDTEQIILLYDDEGTIWGEWRKDGEVKRVVAEECVEYWGYLFSREGITEYYFEIFETDGLELFCHASANYEFISTPVKRFSNTTHIATLNAGLLNSSDMTMVESNAVIPITSISTSPSEFEEWSWTNVEGWAEFYSYEENTVFKINALNITYTPYRNMGEWEIGETTLPIKIHFYEDMKALAVYDFSNYDSKLIFIANMDFNENGDVVFQSAYGNLHNNEIDVKSIVLSKEISMEKE